METFSLPANGSNIQSNRCRTIVIILSMENVEYLVTLQSVQYIHMGEFNGRHSRCRNYLCALQGNLRNFVHSKRKNNYSRNFTRPKFRDQKYFAKPAFPLRVLCCAPSRHRPPWIPLISSFARAKSVRAHPQDSFTRSEHPLGMSFIYSCTSGRPTRSFISCSSLSWHGYWKRPFCN